jgi:hypothetical protein
MPPQPNEHYPRQRHPILTFARRLILGIYWILGGAASILGIYDHGEARHWWNFKWTFSWTFELPSWMLRRVDRKEELIMLAVGLSGPWALMLGGIVGAKLSQSLIRDREITRSAIHSFVRIGFFLAILHCAQVNFGIRIFTRYLSSEGLAKIFIIYLSLGLGLGAVLLPLLNVSITALQARLQRRKKGSTI